MKRYCIRLELSVNGDYPEGSSECGYLLEIPLLNSGHIDSTNWSEFRHQYSVKEFWVDRETLTGQLLMVGENVWYFNFYYPDETLELTYRLGEASFIVGEKVDVRNDHGQVHHFKVVDVKRMEAD